MPTYTISNVKDLLGFFPISDQGSKICDTYMRDEAEFDLDCEGK